MTTCAQAAQGAQWATGGYIDWMAVHRFLVTTWQAALPPSPALPDPGMASQVLTCVEMLFGPDVLGASSYRAVRDTTFFPAGEPAFSDDDFLLMLRAITLAQWPDAELPGPPPFALSSGNRGWWFTLSHPTTASPMSEHFLPGTADFWLCLRRNPTAMDILAGEDPPVRPVLLELKLFPPGYQLAPSAIAPEVAPFAPPGGGLTGITRWMTALEEAVAVPGPGNPFWPPNFGFHKPNFWGEWIGGVVLFQALSDTATEIGQRCSPAATFPALQAGIGMGRCLASAFRWWQQRRNPPVSQTVTIGPTTYTYSVPGPMQWGATETSTTDPVVPSFGDWVPTNRPMFGLFTTHALFLPPPGAPPGWIPPVADPAAGQDWDGSLHQLSRAIVTMHHIGYALPLSEKVLTVVRLYQWCRRPCGSEEFAGPDPCGTGYPWLAATWVGAPRETQGWIPADVGTPEGPCLTDLSTAPDSQAHSLTDVLTVGLAVVRGGLVTLPPGQISMMVQEIMTNCLILVATLYRPDAPAPGQASWTSSDRGLPTDPPESGGLRGLFSAISLLLLLERGPFAGVANLGSLPPGATPAVGLDSFLHVFGGPVPSLLGAYPWNPSHAPP